MIPTAEDLSIFVIVKKDGTGYWSTKTDGFTDNPKGFSIFRSYENARKLMKRHDHKTKLWEGAEIVQVK